MAGTNLKLAFRHIRKHKTLSAINILGLAIGMASFILLGLFVADELSYDRFHRNSDDIYRLQTTLLLNGVTYAEASVPFPAAEALETEFEEVVSAIRIYKISAPLLEVGELKFSEEKFFFADPEIFNLFTYDFIHGNAETALSDPSNVVLTESTARKYFGNQNPIDKILKYQGRKSLRVSAVIKDPPANTHFKFDFLASLDFQVGIWEAASGPAGRHNGWFWTGAWTYFQLNPAASVAALEQKLDAFSKRHFPERIRSGASLNLQSVKDIHLHSQLDNEIEPNGHILYVYIFSAIAVAILLIAIINFTNLTMALSLNRAKEISTRKALGAMRGQLVYQILTESVVTTFISAMIAMLITAVALPFFSTITDKQIIFSSLVSPNYLMALIALTVAVGFLAGSYPAWLISKFSMTGNSNDTSSASGNFLRKILVVFQFTASVVLLIGIGIINKQLNYVSNKELGFKKEGLIVVKGRTGVNKQLEAFKQELLKIPQVKSVSGISSIPGKGTGAWRFVPEGGTYDEPVMLPLTFVDYEFLEASEVMLNDGRFFSRQSPSDANEGFIINESAAKLLNWADPVGKKLELFGPGVNTIMVSGSVIGVVKDFHFESLHHEIKPLVMAYYPDFGHYMVKISLEDFQSLASDMEQTWVQFAPEWPFQFQFLDTELQQLYANEKKLSSTVNYFSVLAILIGCFGLFGLGSFTIMKRVKEIGIRKVLGASINGIFILVSADFLKLISIAVLLAWPLAYFTLNQWLQNFAYSVRVDAIIFIAAGLVALLVGLLTISYHAAKAASTSPVNSLKCE